MMENIITSDYFKVYRKELGFTNQNDAKRFFKADDIIPSINFEYINDLNKRLIEIIKKINSVVYSDFKFSTEQIENFENEYILKSFETMKNSNILQRLNNQGRRPEEVYFSWMRGFVIMNYFTKPISKMFAVLQQDIIICGDDDLNNIDLFKRTPSADLEINTKAGKIRLEIQSGFSGINDIKQHKVIEAKRLFRETKTITLVLHFDIFNGQIAVVRIDNIDDNDLNWITRQQMEGQTVFNINQNYFVWKLTENCPEFEEIKELINEQK